MGLPSCHSLFLIALYLRLIELIFAGGRGRRFIRRATSAENTCVAASSSLMPYCLATFCTSAISLSESWTCSFFVTLRQTIAALTLPE